MADPTRPQYIPPFLQRAKENPKAPVAAPWEQPRPRVAQIPREPSGPSSGPSSPPTSSPPSTPPSEAPVSRQPSDIIPRNPITGQPVVTPPTQPPRVTDPITGTQIPARQVTTGATLTKSQMLQQQLQGATKNTINYYSTQSALESQKMIIQPTATYQTLTGEQLSGSQVQQQIRDVQKQNAKVFGQYKAGQQSSLKMVTSAPAGTTFTPRYITQSGKTTQLDYQVNQLKPSEQVTKLYGSERMDIYAAKAVKDWGIPEAIAGFQTVTGIDKRAWENLHQQYASEILGTTQKKGESFADYTKRFWLSWDAAMDVYLPAATMGLSYYAKPFMLGIKEVPRIGGRLGSFLGHTSYSIGKHSGAIKGALLGGTIGYTGYQMFQNPDAIPLTIGRTLSGFGKVSAAYYAGGSLYSALNRSLIRSSYWTGTAYEQGMIQNAHMRGIQEYQYRPYEFGSPSTHTGFTIKPTMDKFPYVPMHPTPVGSYTMGVIKNNETISLTKIPGKGATRGAVTYTKSIPIDVGTGRSASINMSVSRMFKDGRPGDVFVDTSISRYAGELKGYPDIQMTETNILSQGNKKAYTLSKEFLGDESRPGKYGMISQEPMDVTFSLSKMKTPMYEYTDFGYFTKMKVKGQPEYYGGGSSGASNYINTMTKTDFHLPGGVGEFGEPSLWNKIEYRGAFPKMINRYKSGYMYDESYVSSFWNDVVPRMKTNMNNLSVGVAYKTMSVSQSKTDLLSIGNAVGSKLMNEVKQSYVSVPRSESVSSSVSKVINKSASTYESASKVAQVSVSGLKTAQITASGLEEISITLPRYVTTSTTSFKTPVYYPPTYFPEYKPPSPNIIIPPPYKGKIGSSQAGGGELKPFVPARYKFREFKIPDIDKIIRRMYT